uniref:uncharacterized protein C3orf86 homolog n=1 Tax=Jaculus jaculus TaxID=51337 RepID=UPI001E1AF784|nr:uncharacterized protein C3orf86 homolog [Jaculus jaculus]
MSRSQLGQRKKPLDSFVWVNEITGEVTQPAGEAAGPAVPGEEPRERPGSPRGSVPVTVGQRPVSPACPDAVLKDPSSRNFLPSTPARSLYPSTPAHRPGARSLPGFPAVHRTLSPPGCARPVLRPLGASSPPTCTPPSSPSPPWVFPCKLRNTLTGNNRFSF